MKKAIKKWFVLTLCTFVAAGFTACSDDDDNGDKITIDPIETTKNIRTEAFYKGDIYDNKTGNLWINFISTNLKWDNEENDWVGNGDLICLDFNTILPTNPDFPTLAEGTYNMADSHNKFTLNGYGESYITKYTGTSYTDYWVTGGSVTVKYVGENICISALLELNYDDEQVYEFSYIGPLSIINHSLEGKMSNLTGNVTLNDFTQALAMNLGEAFTETSDYCIVVIAGDDYDLDTNFGDSPSLALGLNITPGSGDNIPSGTYDIISAYDSSDYDAFTCLSGVYQPMYGGYFGAWYF